MCACEHSAGQAKAFSSEIIFSEIIVAPGFIVVYSLMKAKKHHIADSIRTRLQLVIIVKAKADCYIFAYSYIQLHTFMHLAYTFINYFKGQSLLEWQKWHNCGNQDSNPSYSRY